MYSRIRNRWGGGGLGVGGGWGWVRESFEGSHGLQRNKGGNQSSLTEYKVRD